MLHNSVNAVKENISQCQAYCHRQPLVNECMTIVSEYKATLEVIQQRIPSVWFYYMKLNV